MSSSRFPGKISLSIKRQKRQLLDIRSELRNGSRDNVQQHQHQQERETADHVLPQDRISSGLSLFYSLVHPDRDPDVDSDPEDQVTELDFEGFTQDQVDHVRAQQLISYPLSDNGVNGKSVPEPVSGDAEQQAMTAADSSSIRRGSKSVSRKSSANETKSLVSKKESRRKKEPLTNHATKVTATSSSSFSLSSSSLLPLNGANRDPKFVTQSQHDAEDKDVTTSDEAADLIPSLHRDDDITGQEHPDNHRRIISKQPRRQQRPRKEQAKTTDDSEADTENDSDPPVRKRVPGNPSDTIVRKDRGERDDTTSGSGRGNKRKNARRTPSSHQPSLSSSLQVRPATTSSLATISHRDQSPVTSDDSTGDPSHRSQKHSGKNKKAIISQALASLQNKWKERVLSSRQGLGMQRSGSGLAGSCLLLESPATPESPASFSGGSHSRVPGGILREARLQVDESTLNQIRTQTSDDSDDQSTDNEGDSEATTTECGPRGDGSNEDDENLAVREHTSGSSSGRKKSPRKQKRLSVEKAPKHTPKKKNPGTIECVICSAIKYYSHKQRRHGVFACETCAKFFSSFMRNRKAYFCNNTGDCYINEKIQSTRRCRACWLKVCLQKFDVNPEDRDELTQNNFLPKLKSEPHVSLISVDTSSKCDHSFEGSGAEASTPRHVQQACESGRKKRGRKKKSLPGSMNPAPAAGDAGVTAAEAAGLLMLAPAAQRAPESSNAVVAIGNLSRSVRGPRVKTVCRSTATGLPRATFSPKNLNQRHAADDDTVADEDEIRSQRSCDSEDSDAIPVTEYIIRNHEREMLEERRAAGLDVDGEAEGLNDALKENNVKKKSPKKKLPKVTSAEKATTTKKRKADPPETPVLPDKKKKKRKTDSSPNNKNKTPVKGDKAVKRKSDSGVPKFVNKKTVTTTNKNKNKKKKDEKCTPAKKRDQSVAVHQSALPQSTPSKPPSHSAVSRLPAPGTSSHTSAALTTGTPPRKVIKKRCGVCPGCTAQDCGQCATCLDKKRFGGPGLMKQACKLRKCSQMMEPHWKQDRDK